MKKVLLFDLDGTLIDPRLGITSCIRHALLQLEVHPPKTEDLLWCIGPPLVDSFKKLLPVEKHGQIEKAIQFYRERFSPFGQFECTVYDGIKSMLQDLQKRHTLYLATSKPTFFAKSICEHHGLDRYFKKLYGSELDGRMTNKAELLLHLLGAENLEASQCMMIGDREHDVIAANANRIPSVGVTWGYGSLEELKSANAHHVVDSPDALLALVHRHSEDFEL